MNVKCPHCRAEYMVDRIELGRIAECELCGKKFVCIPSFFSLSGRARRSEWWKVWAITLAVDICLTIWLGLFVWHDIAEARSAAYGSLDWWAAMGCAIVDGVQFVCLSVGVSIAIKLATIPVSVRRLHDLNLSGWWLLLEIAKWLPFGPGNMLSIVECVILGCIGGTSGDNNYGTDPKGRS